MPCCSDLAMVWFLTRASSKVDKNNEVTKSIIEEIATYNSNSIMVKPELLTEYDFMINNVNKKTRMDY